MSRAILSSRMSNRSGRGALQLDLKSGAPRARALRMLRQSFETGGIRPGEALPSERTLCQSLNVSRGTLRRVLGTLEDEGLIRPTDGGKTRILCEAGVDAKSPSWLSNSIALISCYGGATVPGHRQQGWGEYAAVAAFREIGRAGKNAMSIGTGSFSKADADWILRARPYGVIMPHLADVHELPRELLGLLNEAKIPTAVYSGSSELGATDRLSSDHDAGAYALTKWMLDRGRNRIVPCYGLDGKDSYWRRGRRSGYERAMRERSLTPIKEILYRPENFDYTTSEGFDARSHYYAGWLASSLLGSEPAEALLCESDGLVYSMAAACRILGKTPNKEVWLAGYDAYWQDVPERQFEPVGPLITIDKQNQLIGEELVRLVIDRASGALPAKPEQRLVTPQLVEIN